jgi:hypothetical protein
MEKALGDSKYMSAQTHAATSDSAINETPAAAGEAAGVYPLH